MFNGSSSGLIGDSKDGGVKEINNSARFGEDDDDVLGVGRSDCEVVGNRSGDKLKCRCWAVGTSSKENSDEELECSLKLAMVSALRVRGDGTGLLTVLLVVGAMLT